MRSTWSAVWSLPLAALVLAGCPSPFEGGVRAVVAFTRADANAGCIRVTAADVATLDGSAVLRASTEVALSDLGTMGQVAVGIGRSEGWSSELEITASLHPGGCIFPSVVGDTRRATVIANSVTTVELTLTQVTRDGGSDGGPVGDSGVIDGGPDAGPFDGGFDAGPFDAGYDAGIFDAGPVDAGFDAGFDAGVFDAGPACTGTFFALPSPQSENYNDVAMFDTNVALLAGNAGSLVAMISDGGFERWSTNTCGTDFKAIWVRKATQVFVAANGGRVMRFSGPASCIDNVAPLRAGTPTAMANYPLGSNTRLWVSSMNPPTIHALELNVAGAQVGSNIEYTPNMGLPDNNSQIYDIDGTSESNVVAVGHFNNKGYILRLSDDKQSFVSVSGGLMLGRVNAIAFASPSVGFAGGEELVVLDGGAWEKAVKPPFEILGLRVFSATNVLAVGEPNGANFGVARWNGATWSSLPGSSADGARLLRVDGTSPCDAWVVGTKKAVLTTTDRP